MKCSPTIRTDNDVNLYGNATLSICDTITSAAADHDKYEIAQTATGCETKGKWKSSGRQSKHQTQARHHVQVTESVTVTLYSDREAVDRAEPCGSCSSLSLLLHLHPLVDIADDYTSLEGYLRTRISGAYKIVLLLV